MRVDAWELAVILVAIWVQRVQRRDQAVGKATADLVKALNAYTDEPAVAAVLPLAVPSPASTAIRGLADETQRHYVANLIDRVKAAPGMPAKVLQRLAALEGAVAKLEAAVIARREAEHAEYPGSAGARSGGGRGAGGVQCDVLPRGGAVFQGQGAC
jgi:hypothetical protein